MDRKRVEGYHKHGYAFFGHLVVVDYETQNETLEDAIQFVQTSYTLKEILLEEPELVCSVE